MRDILFRAKEALTNEWKFGDLYTVDLGDGDKIPGLSVNGHCIDIYIDSIGEYTGIDDVYGNKVFEGDIVKVHDNMIGVEDGAEDFIGVVYYRDGSFMIITPCQLHYRWMDYTVEVIGNKFDNPEIWEEL